MPENLRLEKEEFIRTIKPSQINNIVPFLCSILIPIGTVYAIYKYFVIKHESYELTNQRLIKKTGLFNKKIDELELYRVKDFQVYKPFIYRLFGKGNFIITTSDASHPKIELTGINDLENLRNEFRKLVETRRAEKGVKEFDI